MNGKQVIFIAGCKDQQQISTLLEHVDNCICLVTDTELEGLEQKGIYVIKEGQDFETVFSLDVKIENFVFHYPVSDAASYEPVEVVSEIYRCIKLVYRELLMQRGAKIWFALLPELEEVPERKIINAGITSLMQIMGFEMEKRKIPVNCIQLKNNDLDKIGVLLEYATANPLYLNIQTI